MHVQRLDGERVEGRGVLRERDGGVEIAAVDRRVGGVDAALGEPRRGERGERGRRERGGDDGRERPPALTRAGRPADEEHAEREDGRVYWQDESYNDSRVLVHVPETFDVRKPGVIVVFFHGNGATLERDVRDRQLVPQQISDSGVNAVLLAPQLAVNAANSSAGKFWQPGGFKRFMDKSATHLARLTGDPKSAQAFANMPIVIVGYSGGFLPTAWSLEVGGATSRVRGVFLLDAVYGELDKFASWIANNRSGFFVSSYTRYTKRRDQELIAMLRDKGITVTEHMDGPLRPGSVVFVQTRDGITHRDYVTQAWTEHPVKDVLVEDGGGFAFADQVRERTVGGEPVIGRSSAPASFPPSHHTDDFS